MSIIHCLHVAQNAAVKLTRLTNLTRSSVRLHVTLILIALHALHIPFKIQFKVLVITFRALHGQEPAYIRDLLQPYVITRPPGHYRSLKSICSDFFIFYLFCVFYYLYVCFQFISSVKHFVMSLLLNK